MLAPSGGLLRAGLELKVNQVKTATRSYLRDRTHQATDSLTSYVVAAGLFAAAGIFLIAACLVGITALFRWIEINYGLFWAFGATGALLLVISAICAGIAEARLKRRPREFPSLASRLRVAIKAPPSARRQADAAEYGAKNAGRDVAKGAEVLTAPRRSEISPLLGRNDRSMQVGLVLTAALVGLAAARRRQLVRRMEAEADAPASVRRPIGPGAMPS
jgi:hypothetical protein